jgi:hypothetical protein
VFKQFDVQIITEDTAEQIQSEMRRQKMLQQPSPIGTGKLFLSFQHSEYSFLVPSAALLAMKPTSGTKRSNSTTTGPSAGKYWRFSFQTIFRTLLFLCSDLFSDSNSSAHKKSDVNSKETVMFRIREPIEIFWVEGAVSVLIMGVWSFWRRTR